MIQSFLFAATALAAGQTPLEPTTKTPAELPHMHDVGTPDVAPIPDPGSQPAREMPSGTSPFAGRAHVTQPSVAPALETPLYDVDEHGSVWVLGDSYKASFGSHGATFVPALGARAPRNYPLTFTLAQVTSGGNALAFESQAVARRDGDVVELPRGPFVEQYAISSGGIEQRFVFETLPSRGEIVVSIDVSSELQSRSDAEGFHFENALGAVRYGRAFALDARGTKVGIESRLAGDRIELVVPEEFVAQAELPLVIDPYTSTLSIDVDTGSDWQADVAYDATHNAFVVVYERIFSDTDHDVYARKYVDQVLVDAVIVDVTTDDWRNPKVANNNVANEFLCVAQVGASPNRIIRGRSASAATLNLGAQFTISGTEVGDKLNPDVGGDPATVAPTYYCVVWQRDDTAGDSDIHARLVETDDTLLGTSTIFLANSTTTNDQFPSISKTNGLPPFSTQNWNIVWQHETSTTNDDVQGARILWNGTITDTPFFVASTVENERSPVASEPLDDTSPGRPWLAIYTYDGGLRLRTFEGTTAQATSTIAGPPLGSLGQPVVTTDGRKFPFAYTSSSGAFPFIDVDLNAGTLNYIAGEISYAETTVVASSSSVDETRPEIASTFSSTVTGPWRTYITFDEYNGTDYDVKAVVYDTPANAGGYLYCPGTAAVCPCGNGNNGTLGNAGCANSVNPAGARLDVGGLYAVSQDSTVLYAQGMPTTATCLFFQGTGVNQTGLPFGDGLRCATGTIIRLGTKTASAGNAQYGYPADTSIHTKGLIPAGGGWRYYQCWYRNSAVFCSSSTFNLTNGVALLWQP